MPRALLEGTHGLVRTLARRRFRTFFVRASVVIGPLVLSVGAIASAGRLDGASFALQWLLTFALAAAFAAWVIRRRDTLDRPTLRAIERTTAAHGLLATATGLAADAPDADLAESPFAALARQRAESFLPARWPDAALLWTHDHQRELLLLLILCASLLLLSAPRQWLGEELRPLLERWTSTQDEGPAGATSSDDQAGARSLRELLAASARTEREVVRVDEDVELLGAITTRAPIDRPIDLEVLLLVSDGALTADEGFGLGVRRVDLEGLILPPGPAERVFPQTADLGPILDRLSLRRPGVLTLELALRERGAGPALVLSPPWTLRIEDPGTSNDGTSGSAQAPSSNRPSERPAAPEPDNTPPPGGSPEGPPPALGAPEDLGDFKVRPEAVDAEIRDGPSVEKEVRVFERELGAQSGRPAPPAPPRFDRATLERRAETAIERQDLPPAERRLLEAYFRRLQGPR